MHDLKRGTGRTTGLILKAISEAILSPGVPVLFRDHDSSGRPRAKLFCHAIAAVIEGHKLSGFQLQPRADGSVRITYRPELRFNGDD